MELKEILVGSGGAFLLLLSFIQIAPIKINPWSAFFGWIGNQLNKELKDSIDSVKKDVQSLKTDVCNIRDEAREKQAKECRIRILRFSDEIYLGQNHSQEHFQQILVDITHYERYCKDNPQFENNIAVAAIEQIKESYNTRLRKHDFLN